MTAISLDATPWNLQATAAPHLGRDLLDLRAGACPLGGPPAPAHFGAMVARSAKMKEVFARMARFAQSNAAVLIEGETGTGKELGARAMHDASGRASGPFVVIDCGSLPESLLEAELFGHSRGAFTGAAESRVGAIEAAQGGTVFLDELGELPLAMQPKLLRAIESRTVRRLGETAYRPVDVRFISATHRDLEAMVRAGAFREDLFFRVAVLPVTIPALRDRPADILALVRHFLPPRAQGLLNDELAAELVARPWHGNARELRNFVEQLLALGAAEALSLGQRSGQEPAPRSCQRAYAAALAHPTAAPAPTPAPTPCSLPYRETRERAWQDIEKRYLAGLLLRHEHNVSAAAVEARLNRTYLHRLIRKHGL